MESPSWLATARDVVVVLSGVVGLGFAVYRYKRSREAEAVLEITMEMEQVHAGGQTLLDVAIRVKNAGKAAAFVDAEGAPQARCRFRPIPSDFSDGVLSWDSLDGHDLVDSTEYMRDWYSYYPKEPMIFEPGTTETFLDTLHRGIRSLAMELIPWENLSPHTWEPL
jgi:hypothetical protein